MNLKELREAKNMTQVQVAVAVGCSLTSYRLWEIGVMKPSEKNLKKLKEVLGVK